MKVSISIRVMDVDNHHYYDDHAIDREMVFEAEDVDALHTLAGNCGPAIEKLITAAIEDRAAMLTEDTEATEGDTEWPTN